MLSSLALIDPRVSALAPAPASDPALDLARWRSDNDALGVKLGGEPVEVERIDTITIACRDGAEISALVYYPLIPKPEAPITLYAHGGGWVVGSPLGTDRVTRALAQITGGPVVSVAYRKAPEFLFPVPMDDFEDSLQWVRSHAAFKHLPVWLAGDSAGAHLALAVTFRALDQSAPVAASLAIYPCLDPACDSPSMRAFADGFGLQSSRMKWFWETTLGNEVPNAALTPWLRKDLSGIGPVWIGSAQCDVLRDEGQVFAARLAAAGVAVSQLTLPGMLHGFMRWRGLVPHGQIALEHAVASLSPKY